MRWCDDTVTMGSMYENTGAGTQTSVRLRGDFSRIPGGAEAVQSCFNSYLSATSLPMDTSWRYGSMGSLLLEHAEVIPGCALGSRFRRGVERHCFDNAQRLAMASKGRLTYVEGLALGAFFPMHHGWCVRTEEPDVIVDVTWSTPEHCAYLGIRFDTSFVRAYRRGRQDVAILDDWQHGHPLLKYGPDASQLA